MKRNEIASVYADAESLTGQTLTVCGWVRTLRESKSLAFIELNDGSCQRNLQVVAERDALENFAEIVHCLLYTSPTGRMPNSMIL